MAIAVKPVAEIAEKWRRRAGAAGPDYEKGVSAPAKDFATNAAAAEPAYEAGVQDAISRKAFGRGVKKAGTGKWQDKAKTLGVARYPTGVAAGQTAFATGFAPMAEAIGRQVLPVRGRAGDPSNIERVRQIADALHKVKISAGGA